jgi:hypothetical protein
MPVLSDSSAAVLALCFSHAWVTWSSSSDRMVVYTFTLLIWWAASAQTSSIWIHLYCASCVGWILVDTNQSVLSLILSRSLTLTSLGGLTLDLIQVEGLSIVLRRVVTVGLFVGIFAYYSLQHGLLRFYRMQSTTNPCILEINWQNWSTTDCTDWIKGQCNLCSPRELQQFCCKVEKEQIMGCDLARLSIDHWRSLGLSLGPAVRLHKSIERLVQDYPDKSVKASPLPNLYQDDLESAPSFMECELLQYQRPQYMDASVQCDQQVEKPRLPDQHVPLDRHVQTPIQTDSCTQTINYEYAPSYQAEPAPLRATPNHPSIGASPSFDTQAINTVHKDQDSPLILHAGHHLNPTNETLVVPRHISAVLERNPEMWSRLILARQEDAVSETESAYPVSPTVSQYKTEPAILSPTPSTMSTQHVTRQSRSLHSVPSTPIPCPINRVESDDEEEDETETTQLIQSSHNMKYKSVYTRHVSVE